MSRTPRFLYLALHKLLFQNKERLTLQSLSLLAASRDDPFLGRWQARDIKDDMIFDSCSFLLYHHKDLPQVDLMNFRVEYARRKSGHF